LKGVESERITAAFAGYQPDGFGNRLALFLVQGGELDGSTVTTATLKKYGIEVPPITEDRKGAAA